MGAKSARVTDTAGFGSEGIGARGSNMDWSIGVWSCRGFLRPGSRGWCRVYQGKDGVESIKDGVESIKDGVESIKARMV